MDVVVPLPIVVAQWVALLALAILVILMYRQLALLLTSREPAPDGPEALHRGLGVGASAPAFNGTVITDGGTQALSWAPHGTRPSLLMFADPLCGGCEKSVIALNEAQRSGYMADVDAYILTTEEAGLLRAVDAFRTSAVPVVQVDRGVSLTDFAVRVTPFFYLVDPDGRILATRPGVDSKVVRDMLGLAQKNRKEREWANSLSLLPIAAEEAMRVATSEGEASHELETQ